MARHTTSGEAMCLTHSGATDTLSPAPISLRIVSQCEASCTILGRGGSIYMVHVEGRPVGCVALIPIGGGVYELSKMAILPELRGMGIGRRLLEHAICRSTQHGRDQPVSRQQHEAGECGSPL